MDIAICEDIPQHADRLAEMIEAYYVNRKLPTLHKFERCSLFLEKYWDSKMHYDAIFLDIIMPGINGLLTAKQIRMADESVPIVFITSAQEFVKKGYEYDAISFLLKPVEQDELFRTLNRIENRHKKIGDPSVLIVLGDQVERVPIQHIISIQRQKRKTVINKIDGTVVYTNQAISSFANALQLMPNFTSIFQSDYVNLKHVVRIDKKWNRATLANGQVMMIGRNRLKSFLDALIAFYGEE